MPELTKIILLADDDPEDQEILEEEISKLAPTIRLEKVDSGKQAVDYLLSCSDDDLPCLIILDINMPILDGKETLSIIKRTEAFQSIPVVVFTTSNSELDKIFCKKFEVEMITKPPNFRNLEKAVLKLLNFCSR